MLSRSGGTGGKHKQTRKRIRQTTRRTAIMARRGDLMLMVM